MTGDLYPRPDRTQIAAKVAAKAGPMENFATHLSARLRALGWDQAVIQDQAGITAQTAARAINGTGVSLELAGQIAELTGLTLAVMIGPYMCRTCDGEPPAGFRCLECDKEGERR